MVDRQLAISGVGVSAAVVAEVGVFNAATALNRGVEKIDRVVYVFYRGVDAIIAEWIFSVEEWMRSIAEWIFSVEEWMRSIVEWIFPVEEWITRCP